MDRVIEILFEIIADDIELPEQDGSDFDVGIFEYINNQTNKRLIIS